MGDSNFDEIRSTIEQSAMNIYELENTLGIDQSNPGSITLILEGILGLVEQKIEELADSETVIESSDAITVNDENFFVIFQNLLLGRKSRLESLVDLNNKIKETNSETEILNKEMRHNFDEQFLIYVCEIKDRNISLNSKKLAIISCYNKLNKESLDKTGYPLLQEINPKLLTGRKCDFTSTLDFIRIRK